MPITSDLARYYAAWGSEVAIRNDAVVSADLVARLTGTSGVPYEAARLRGSDSKLVLPGGIALAFPAGSGTLARLEDITVGGGGESSAFEQIFTSVSSVVCVHNFGAKPAVQCLDDGGSVFVPLDITHDSVNQFTVTFASARSGTVLANYGGGTGSGPSSLTTDDVPEGSLNLYYTNGRADARIAAAVGVSVQAYSAALDAVLGVNTGDQDLSGYALTSQLHDPVTLDANADTLLSLTAQALGLDTQTANLVFAGPTTGAAAVPTFRALVAGDVPDLSGVYQPLDSDLTSWAGVARNAGFDAFAASLDHGALTGLTPDDDHTQYALLAGRAGGQTLIGGTAAADDLILRATSGVGAGSETIIFQGGNNGATEWARLANGALSIGSTASDARRLFLDDPANAVTAAAFNIAAKINTVLNPASASAATDYGLWLNLSSDAANAQNFTGSRAGIKVFAQHHGSGVMAGLQGQHIVVSSDGSGYVEDMTGQIISARHDDSSGHAVTAAVGQLIDAGNQGTGVLAFAIGQEVDLVSTSGTITAGIGTIYGANAATLLTGGTLTNATWIQTGAFPAGPTYSNPPVALKMAAQSVAGAYQIKQLGTGGMNVLAGNTRVGGTTDPTVAADITGNALISGTLGVTGAISGTTLAMTATGSAAFTLRRDAAGALINIETIQNLSTSTTVNSSRAYQFADSDGTTMSGARFGATKTAQTTTTITTEFDWYLSNAAASPSKVLTLTTAALYPETAGGLTLGKSGNPFGDVWIGGGSSKGFVDLEEYNTTTDAAAPSDNHARLYARDNGAGKEQLVVRFNTGAVQVIATEP